MHLLSDMRRWLRKVLEPKRVLYQVLYSRRLQYSISSLTDAVS